MVSISCVYGSKNNNKVEKINANKKIKTVTLSNIDRYNELHMYVIY